jgi:ubiquitin-conjugating enzyme E2 J1
METDVKGQLGGMETSKKERERLAGDSGKWKCSICQRTNKEILDESSEAARLKAEADGDAGGSGEKEEEVPAELKIAYKDETKKDDSSEEKAEEEEDAQLAEGFVRTGNTGEPSKESSSVSSPYPSARPVQSIPQPTVTATQSIPAPPRITPAPTATFPRQRVEVRSNEGVPIWLDRTIAAVVICIVALVLKMLFGY